MARYKVIGPDFEDQAGLSLEEAFARMMAPAGTEYIFSRHNGTTRLRDDRLHRLPRDRLQKPKRYASDRALVFV